jgi:hypothetical protein
MSWKRLQPLRPFSGARNNVARPCKLPHSGRFFLHAVARMDYRDACRQYDDWMEAIAKPGRPTATVPLPSPAPLERLPISVVTLEPDILAPWTIDSWLTGKDPMMDAVTALVDRGPDNN